MADVHVIYLRCLSSVEGKDRKWLKQQLRHSHEPPAAERIKRLIENHGADWLLKKDEVAMAADLRNYYIHFDPQIDQRLPPAEMRFRIMHNLAVRLGVLCELILLHAIGFSTDDLRERIKKTRRLERNLVDTGSGNQG